MITLLECEALGTHWWIQVFEDVELATREAIAPGLTRLITQFEENYSRFRPTSLISQLNRGEVLTEFPEELFAILSWGERLRKLSGGYFTLGIGGALERLGYDESYSFTSLAPQALRDFSPLAVLSRQRIQVASGIHLDLGGVGKGWLIDRLADNLAACGLRFFSINGGGDIYATSDKGDPIEYALENPLNAAEAIGTVKVLNRAVAASGGLRRRWKDKLTGKESHHLVDPFSGDSSDRHAGVFAAAATATNADAASTILYLVPETLIDSVARELAVEYLIVNADGRAVRSPAYPGMLYE